MASPTGRLKILKTYKLFIGGKFPRTESGRYLVATKSNGKSSPKIVANYSQASRKDLRDAVRAARGAQSSWANSSAYLRGQILYRMAEMLESRGQSFREELSEFGKSPEKANQEIAASIDRLVYFAGWSDKVDSVFGTVNPVASSHWNVTSLEPTGVVGLICPDEPSLLGLVTLVAATVVTGNAVVAIASETNPLSAVSFAEVLATSDLPNGVVNILTGKRSELAPGLSSHMDINGVIDGSSDLEIAKGIEEGVSQNVKRVHRWLFAPQEWYQSTAEDPYRILDAMEFKTAWHPRGF